jgi:hypothetical protein
MKIAGQLFVTIMASLVVALYFAPKLRRGMHMWLYHRVALQL